MSMTTYSPLSMAVAEVAHPAFIMTAMLFGFLPLVGLLIMAIGKFRRHCEFLRLWRLPLAAARLLRSAFGRRHKDKHAEAVDERMNQWRDKAACITAGVLLYTRLVELPCVLFIEGAVCTTPGVSPKLLREFLAAEHVIQVWVCVAFLFAQGGCRGKNARLRQAFTIVTTMCFCLKAWLGANQVILLESWTYRMTLGLLCFGSSASPALALPCVGVYVLAACMTYRAYIPDGMIAIKQMTNDVGPCEVGCMSFVDPAVAHKALRALARHGDAFPRLSEAEVELLMGLADGVLKGKTRFWVFVQQELVMLATLAILLLFLHFVFHAEAARSLTLQSSAEQLAALSRMLANYTDATVQLFEDGHIVEDAPKLDLMLHLGPTPQGLRGKDFASFIASPEDRSRFQEAIRPGWTGGVLAGDALYLDLRTALHGVACGNVRAQLLGAEFMDGSGERRLLFGLVELQTDGQAALHDTIAPIPPEGNKKEMKYKLKIKLDEDERSARAYQNHQGTPVAAASAHSGSLSDRGSDSDSESESVASAGRGVHPGSGTGSIDTSTDNLEVEVELAEAGSWVCRATKEFRFMSGLRQTRSKADLALAGVFQDPEQVASALRAFVGWTGETRGAGVLRLSLAKRPLELVCRVLPSQPAAESSDRSTPRVRLQVLSIRGAQAPAGPSSGAEPEMRDQPRAGCTMQI